MNEYLCAIAILLADWGAAASHMAFDRFELKPFYARRIPIWSDPWHLISGLRYIPMLLLMWVSYGWQWEWWLGTAVVCQIGWYALKRLHRKDWGHSVLNRWMK